MDSSSWGWVVRQLGFRDPLLNQLVEDMEIEKLVLGIILRLYRVVLESYDLSLELFIEPPQCLMLTNGILTVESCMLLIVI